MLQETTEKEVFQRLDANTVQGKEALLFHTPFCGTCRLAERMLEIAEEAGPTIPATKLNINFAPKLRDAWQISSVPCLVVLENGVPVLKEYAMGSVVDLYQWLRKE
ncbi:thioredoxin family protein [Paenibacillus sp. M1]|uniref:Thioredoxin family protein n=1 Tax=Paenibacillus haidiansis TaxID=1574488 RepID=A0ABU7VRN4_9BACL